MNIITCYKSVPDEQDIIVNSSDGSLDFSRANTKISQYDLNAIETANQIKAQQAGSKIIALSVGGKALTNIKARKDVLSRGPDELVVVIDDQLEHALPHQTALTLSSAAQKVGFDLIICGDGSADLNSQQVSILLGETLQVPAVNGVKKIVSISADTVVVERELEDEIETLSIPLPAIIAVTPDINVPVIPSMKSILGAAKKHVQVWTMTDIGLDNVSILSKQFISAPKQKTRQHIIIEGDGEDQIAQFAEHLRKII